VRRVGRTLGNILPFVYAYNAELKTSPPQDEGGGGKKENGKGGEKRRGEEGKRGGGNTPLGNNWSSSFIYLSGSILNSVKLRCFFSRSRSRGKGGGGGIAEKRGGRGRRPEFG